MFCYVLIWLFIRLVSLVSQPADHFFDRQKQETAFMLFLVFLLAIMAAEQ